MAGGRSRAVRVGGAAGALLLGLVGVALVRTAVTGATPPAAPDLAAPGATVAVQPRTRPVRPRPSAAATGGTGVRDRIAGPTLPESRPLRVEIPRIGVSSTLEQLGLDAAGDMQVPRDPARAGWYSRGPTPGALGPAVIAGHVTWNRVPAVFFRLGSMRRGDRVDVARADGTRAVFAVTRVATFDKASFPTRAVFGGIDHAGLRLITCGGSYDTSTHRYAANVVVFGRLVRS